MEIKWLGLLGLGLALACEVPRVRPASPSPVSFPDESAQGLSPRPEDEPEPDPEEAELDDEALAALIAAKLQDQEQDQDVEAAPRAPSLSLEDGLAGDVPPAVVTANLSSQQCREELRKRGVTFEVPSFQTPDVETPVLLAGPIESVEIGPRWPKVSRVQEVMDCRLALALVGLARIAGAQGIRKILYYSIYRPAPAGKPRRGGSQHRRGMAIDIGWLELDNGERVSVLESYPRRNKKPPCDEVKVGQQGRGLQRFVCQAHAEKLFQVMLTPNANPAHHNHFHFDLVSGVRWYIFH